MFLALWNSSSDPITFPCYDLSKNTTFCHNLLHILTISSRSLMPNTITFTVIFLYYILCKMAYTLVIFPILVFFFEVSYVYNNSVILEYIFVGFWHFEIWPLNWPFSLTKAFAKWPFLPLFKSSWYLNTNIKCFWSLFLPKTTLT